MIPGFITLISLNLEFPDFKTFNTSLAAQKWKLKTISLTMVKHYASWFGLANLKQNPVVCSMCVNIVWKFKWNGFIQSQYSVQVT